MGEGISMKTIPIWIILLVLTNQLLAQHFVTFGIGFSGMLNNSDDLNRFTETYNFVNSPTLRSPLNGFNWSLGLRPEVGYRYLDKWNTAFVIGIHRSVEHDFANFTNGESRKLELRISGGFLDCEIGRRWNNFIINSMLKILPTQ